MHSLQKKKKIISVLLNLYTHYKNILIVCCPFNIWSGLTDDNEHVQVSLVNVQFSLTK